jgi:hypothetical protein
MKATELIQILVQGIEKFGSLEIDFMINGCPLNIDEHDLEFLRGVKIDEVNGKEVEDVSTRKLYINLKLRNDKDLDS